jgi:hypothetical protein
MARCVEQHHHVTWNSGRKTQTGVFSKAGYFEEPAPGLKDESASVVGTGMYEPGGWGYKVFLNTSPTVIWALLRATHLGTTDPADIDYDVVAKEFKRLLTLACKPHPHPPTYKQSADIQTSRNQM